MSDRAQKYGEWLVNNQDKKGSPEWNTVSSAYKAARQEMTQAQPQPSQPQAQVQAQPQAQQQPQPAPTQAEGDGIGEVLQYGTSGLLQRLGKSAKYGLNDIMGNLLTVEKDGEEVFNLGDSLGLTGDAANKIYQGVGEGVEQFGADIAPKDYTPAQVLKDPSKPFYDPSNISAMGLLKATGEALPGLGLSMVPGLAIPVGAGQVYGDAFEERMKNQGYTDPSQMTAEDKQWVADAAAFSALAERVGVKGIRSVPMVNSALSKLSNSSVGKAVANATSKASLATGEAGRRIGQVVSNVGAKTGRALGEGVTEGSQEIAQQVGETAGTKEGLNIDTNRAGVAGLTGFTSRAGLSAPGVVIKGTDNLLLGAQTKVKDRQAATNFANMAQSIAENEGINISDLTEANYANEANSKIFNTVHKELASSINGDFRRLAPLLKEDMGQDSARNLYDTVLTAVDMDKLDAAQKSGVNRHEGLVTKEQLAILERIVGHTEEGQRLLLNLRTSNEMTNFVTEMRKSKKGGITGTIENKVGRYSKALAGGLAGGTAVGAFLAGPDKMAAAALADPFTAGVATAAAGSAYGLLYGIDKATGRRSKAARYIDDYAGKAMTPIGGQSFVGERIRQRELLRAADSADKAQGLAQKVLSDQIVRQSILYPQTIDRAFVLENEANLTTPHLRAVESVAEANERARINEMRRNAKTQEEAQAAEQEAYRAEVLKYLTDRWRANALDPREIEQYRSVLKPNEYKALVKEQLGDDKRKVAFAYQMAEQKAAEAEAIAADLERTAKELERDNRRAEALQAREDAKAAKEQAKADKQNAKELLDGIESDLVLRNNDGTLTEADVLQHQEVLTPAKLGKYLRAAKALKKAQQKADEAKATRKPKHTGQNAAKRAAIVAQSAVDPNVQSPQFESGTTDTGRIRTAPTFVTKGDWTDAYEDQINGAADLYALVPSKRKLGIVLRETINYIRTTAKNDHEKRIAIYEAQRAKLQGDPELQAEYDRLMMEENGGFIAAFGEDLGRVSSRTDQLMNDPNLPLSKAEPSRWKGKRREAALQGEKVGYDPNDRRGTDVPF